MSPYVSQARRVMSLGALLVGLHANYSAFAADTEQDASMDDRAHAAAEDESAAQARSAYQAALQALEQQQWVQAELLLERALMFQPEHAEALLQLASLLAQRDRLETAQALIAMLLNDPRTPPQHRRRLQALLDNTSSKNRAEVGSAGAVAQRPQSTQMLWSLGYAQNPLGATSATQLTLTLPDGPVTLPLAGAASGSAIASVALHHQRASGLEIYVQSQQPSLRQARSAKRLALAGNLGWQNYQWSMSTQQALDGSMLHDASLVRTLEGGVQLRAGVFRESTSSHSGFRLRGQGVVKHAGSDWPTALVWGEYEHRRGGTPSAVRVGVQSHVQIAPGWQVQGQLNAQVDVSGYSVLLERNASRRFISAQGSLEYRWPTPVMDGQISMTVYAARRWSNLPLFNWQDQGANIAWLRQW